MDVERLIVMVLSATKGSYGHSPTIQANDRRDGYALATRFLGQREKKTIGDWEKIANQAGLDVAGHVAAQIGKHGAMVVHYVDGDPQAKRSAIRDFLKGAKTCGAYILMHGVHGMATPNDSAETCLSPRHVANEMNTLCPQSVGLLKVNIVGCSLANFPDGMQGTTQSRAPIKAAGSWAQAFCQELQRPETMVAAYTEAVYVARDNNIELNSSSDGLSGESLRPPGSKLGQKAVSLGKAAKIETVAAHRTQVKKVFQYDGSKAAGVELDQYKAWKYAAWQAAKA